MYQRICLMDSSAQYRQYEGQFDPTIYTASMASQRNSDRLCTHIVYTYAAIDTVNMGLAPNGDFEESMYIFRFCNKPYIFRLLVLLLIKKHRLLHSLFICFFILIDLLHPSCFIDVFTIILIIITAIPSPSPSPSALNPNFNLPSSSTISYPITAASKNLSCLSQVFFGLISPSSKTLFSSLFLDHCYHKLYFVQALSGGRIHHVHTPYM